jgi:MFS family permease
LPTPSGPLLRFLVPVALFTLGHASDAFLLLRAGGEAGTSSRLPLLWMGFHAVKVVSSLLGGRLGDRWDRRWVIAGGWLVSAAVYLGFAFASSDLAVIALFLFYGSYHGLTEGSEKALVADLTPARGRGGAFGWYHLTIGLLALPASLLFGAIWERWDPRAAFLTGSGLALAAVLALLLLVPPASRPPAPAAAATR